MEKIENETFLNYTNSCLTDYLQEKINFYSPVHKRYKKEYNEVLNRYPNVIKGFEDVGDTYNIEFTKEELQAFLKLRKIELEVRAFENEICFKLGINEILKFKI